MTKHGPELFYEPGGFIGAVIERKEYEDCDRDNTNMPALQHLLGWGDHTIVTYFRFALQFPASSYVDNYDGDVIQQLLDIIGAVVTTHEDYVMVTHDTLKAYIAPGPWNDKNKTRGNPSFKRRWFFAMSAEDARTWASRLNSALMQRPESRDIRYHLGISGDKPRAVTTTSRVRTVNYHNFQALISTTRGGQLSKHGLHKSTVQRINQLLGADSAYAVVISMFDGKNFTTSVAELVKLGVLTVEDSVEVKSTINLGLASDDGLDALSIRKVVDRSLMSYNSRSLPLIFFDSDVANEWLLSLDSALTQLFKENIPDPVHGRALITDGPSVSKSLNHLKLEGCFQDKESMSLLTEGEIDVISEELGVNGFFRFTVNLVAPSRKDATVLRELIRKAVYLAALLVKMDYGLLLLTIADAPVFTPQKSLDDLVFKFYARCEDDAMRWTQKLESTYVKLLPQDDEANTVDACK